MFHDWPAPTFKENLPIYFFCGLLQLKQIVWPGLCFKDQHEDLLALTARPRKPWKQQERVQGKKRLRVKKCSLKSVAFLVKGEWERSGDHMASRKSHRCCTPDWLCWGWIITYFFNCLKSANYYFFELLKVRKIAVNFFDCSESPK